MSTPKEDPERLTLRAAPTPVRRLNRRALVIAAGVLGGGVLGITLWSLQPERTSLEDEVPTPPTAQVERVSRAEGLESLPRDYGSTSSVPRLGPPLGELGRPVLRAEQAAGIDSFSTGDGFVPDAVEDAERAARLRDAQEDTAAAKAQVFFQLTRRQLEQSLALPDAEATSSLERALSLVPGSGMQSSDADDSGDGSADPNGQATKRAFVGNPSQAEIYAQSELQTPRSPYQLMAGTVIPAALVTGINSDLPGQIIASVTENIFDTVSGRYLLIPQGSRLLGRYDSDVAFGQRRVLLVWTRLLRPDGSSITLDRLQGVDAGGYAGLEDTVDRHWSRIFVGAAVSSLIGVGAELASPTRQENGNAVVLAGRESIQSSVTDVGQQITQRNLDVQPTLTVRPGFPVRIIANTDLVLLPFQSDLRPWNTP